MFSYIKSLYYGASYNNDQKRFVDGEIKWSEPEYISHQHEIYLNEFSRDIMCCRVKEGNSLSDYFYNDASIYRIYGIRDYKVGSTWCLNVSCIRGPEIPGIKFCMGNLDTLQYQYDTNRLKKDDIFIFPRAYLARLIPDNHCIFI